MSGKAHKRHQRWMLLLGTGLVAGWSTASLAGGLGLPLQSATQTGTAFAGAGSEAIDAGTGFWNSAGLTRLKGKQLVAGGFLNVPSTMLHVSSATSNQGVHLTPASARPSNSAFIPFLHYSQKINDRWAYSLNAITTFGSKTNYKDNSVARYVAARSEMMAINMGPSLAYRFDHGFSLGGGVDALYVSAQLASKLNITDTLANDGFAKTTVSRTGFGYHVGLLQELSERTRLGAQYRSKIHIKGKGDATTQLMPTLPITNKRVSGTIDFPEYVLLSAYHDVSEKWALMSDLQLTHWSTFKNLVFNFEDGTSLNAPQNYKNNYRFAVGGAYQFDDTWRFKMGGSYETRATQTIGRSIFIPDQDQIVPAVGVQYRLNKRMAVDLAYAHLFFKKADINQSAPVGTPPSSANVTGDMRHQINCIGMQLTWDL